MGGVAAKAYELAGCSAHGLYLVSSLDLCRSEYHRSSLDLDLLKDPLQYTVLDTNIVGCLWLEEFDLWYKEFLFRVGLILDQYLKFVPHTLLSMRPPPTLLKHRIAKVTGLELYLGFIKGLGVGALNKVLGFRGFSEFV